MTRRQIKRCTVGQPELRRHMMAVHAAPKGMVATKRRALVMYVAQKLGTLSPRSVDARSNPQGDLLQ